MEHSKEYDETIGVRPIGDGDRTVRSRRPLLMVAVFVVLSMLLAACGDSGDSDEAADGESVEAGESDGDDDASADDDSVDDDAAAGDGEPVTIEWWHIHNTEPMLTVWQTIAEEFMAMHPNVTIDINVMENEAFKTALQANLQAGDVPDLFQSWGGGGLKEQVEAGLVQDVTDPTSEFIGDLNPGAVGLYQVDGKQYGVPFNLGMVGFWYNKALFAEAGVDAPPETWDEFLDVVQQLKDAGITPIALGAGDKWPAHFYYSYLMLRIGGQEAMDQVAVDGDFTAEPFIEAGDELQRLIDLDPFQAGFLATPWDGADGEAGVMGSKQAAMDLMGQWAPEAFKNASPDGTGLGDDLGWFPFPAVEGGAGTPTDAFGGGDGIAVGKDAPPEAVEFLAYIAERPQAERLGESGAILPVVDGAEVSVTDPNQQLVLAGISEATFVQLYLDQFFSPELGAVVNDEVQTLFAGTADSSEVAAAITEAAQG